MKEKAIKVLPKLMILLILCSCTNPNLIVDTGKVDNGTYINSSIGISIDYERTYSPFLRDSLNRSKLFEKINTQIIDLNTRTEAFLIGFFNNENRTDILLSVVNNKEVSIEDVKDFIFTNSRKEVEKSGIEMKIKSSKTSDLSVNGTVYKYFSATYSLPKQNYIQRTKYAYCKHNDFLLLIELPITSSIRDKHPDKPELIKFLRGINFKNT